MRLTVNSTVVADDNNDDNGVCEITTTGGVSGKTIEFRITGSGNPTNKKRWRILLNETGGIEIQRASDDWSQQWGIISLGAQGNACIELESRGINLPVQNLDGRFAVRSGEGVELGAMRCVSNGQGGFQIIFSARNNQGQWIDMMALDPDQASDGCMAIIASGAPHRLRRDSSGNATLL